MARPVRSERSVRVFRAFEVVLKCCGPLTFVSEFFTYGVDLAGQASSLELRRGRLPHRGLRRPLRFDNGLVGNVKAPAEDAETDDGRCSDREEGGTSSAHWLGLSRFEETHAVLCRHQRAQRRLSLLALRFDPFEGFRLAFDSAALTGLSLPRAVLEVGTRAAAERSSVSTSKGTSAWAESAFAGGSTRVRPGVRGPGVHRVRPASSWRCALDARGPVRWTRGRPIDGRVWVVPEQFVRGDPATSCPPRSTRIEATVPRVIRLRRTRAEMPAARARFGDRKGRGGLIRRGRTRDRARVGSGARGGPKWVGPGGPSEVRVVVLLDMRDPSADPCFKRTATRPKRLVGDFEPKEQLGAEFCRWPFQGPRMRVGPGSRTLGDPLSSNSWALAGALGDLERERGEGAFTSTLVVTGPPVSGDFGVSEDVDVYAAVGEERMTRQTVENALRLDASWLAWSGLLETPWNGCNPMEPAEPEVWADLREQADRARREGPVLYPTPLRSAFDPAARGRTRRRPQGRVRERGCVGLRWGQANVGRGRHAHRAPYSFRGGAVVVPVSEVRLASRACLRAVRGPLLVMSTVSRTHVSLTLRVR